MQCFTKLFKVLGLVLLALSFNSWACTEVAQLTKTSGQVQVFQAKKPFPLKSFTLPHSLCAGDKVQTASQAKATILHSQGKIALDEASRLEISSQEATNLEDGTALFQITKRSGQKFASNTPLVVIGVKGTEYLLTSQANRDDISLYQGAVEVTRQDEQEMAYFKAKPVSQMSFEEYKQMQTQAFSDYKKLLQMQFEDYKKQQMAEFDSYKKSVDLSKGKQLTLNNGKPEAVEADISKATDATHKELKKWLK